MAKSSTYYLLSLGCAKNLVDSECMSQEMRDAGWISVAQPGNADLLIVNTCGFIGDAKRESIAAILDLAAYKKPAGRATHLIVAGCLAQRYAGDIQRQIPEVDSVLGTGEYGEIAQLAKQLRAGGPPRFQPGAAGGIKHLRLRQPSTPSSYAYLKVAEGCSNHCTYCAIPLIRGPLVSRPVADLVTEANDLARQGHREIILIAQDLGRYGSDRVHGRDDFGGGNQNNLTELIRRIASIPEVRLIRLLYLYSDGITPDLLELFRTEPKLAHYVDMPIQHASDAVLRRMGRRDRQADIRRAVAQLREVAPDMVIRTTVMVGFPGETEEDFAELIQLLEDIQFDRLGCFAFSAEENTPAIQLPGKVHWATAAKRRRQILFLQQKIAARLAQKRVGQIIPVTLESVDDDGIFYKGRSFGEAPDVDPVIRVAATQPAIRIGDTVPVRIVSADDYDWTGVTVN